MWKVFAKSIYTHGKMTSKFVRTSLATVHFAALLHCSNEYLFELIAVSCNNPPLFFNTTPLSLNASNALSASSTVCRSVHGTIFQPRWRSCYHWQVFIPLSDRTAKGRRCHVYSTTWSFKNRSQAHISSGKLIHCSLFEVFGLKFHTPSHTIKASHGVCF